MLQSQTCPAMRSDAGAECDVNVTQSGRSVTHAFYDAIRAPAPEDSALKLPPTAWIS
jgi:hypothetical protein